MGKNRISGSFWFRFALGVLGFAAVLVALTWLMHRYWIIFQRISFGDALFAMGALSVTMASAGLMRNNVFGVMLSPWGVPAFPIEPSEQEQRDQLVADFIEQQAFGLRLFAAGLITLLLSIWVSNMK